MGSVCCCFCVEDPEENVNGSNKTFIHTLLSKYAAVFSNGETSAFPTANDGEPILNSNAAPNNVQSSTIMNPPRELLFDANLRPSNLQEDGLAATHENGAGQLHKDIEQLRGGECMLQEIVTESNKSKECSSESSIKVSKEKEDSGVRYMFASLDDEDVCPTCLEEYSLENPRIVTQCSHHYHLSCIYEWMERSENCPVCSKVMIFDEAS